MRGLWGLLADQPDFIAMSADVLPEQVRRCKLAGMVEIIADSLPNVVDNRPIQEKVAEAIDEEIRRLIDDAYAKALELFRVG